MEEMSEKRLKEINLIIFKNIDERNILKMSGIKKGEATSEEREEFIRNSFWEPFCSDYPKFNKKEINILNSKVLFIEAIKKDFGLFIALANISKEWGIVPEEFFECFRINIKRVLEEIT